MTTTRSMTPTGDQFFVVPLDEGFNFAWAYNSATQDMTNYHMADSHFMVILPSDGFPMKVYEASGAFYMAATTTVATLALALL